MDRDYLVRIRGKSPRIGSRDLDRAFAKPLVTDNVDNPDNIANRFLQVCKSNLHRPAVFDGHGSFAYQWLFRQASRIAEAIKTRPEFAPGEHVGLFLDNSPEYIAAFYGIVLAGGVVVPIPTYHKYTRLKRLCELADLNLLLDGPVLTAVSDELPFGEPDTLKLDSDNPCRLQKVGTAHPDSLAMMLFTSGSTGDPKAVMLSHRNVLANSDSICQFLPISTHDRSLAVMPFAHALGNSVLQSHVLSGAGIVFGNELLFPNSLLKALKQQECTSLTAVPEVFESLLIAIGDEPAKLPSLNYLAVAGGKLDPSCAVEIASKIKPADFFVMYGQTEATARLSYLPPTELPRNADTIGSAIPGVELRVLNHRGEVLSKGEAGLLHARGDNIMMGYWKDPQATQSVLQDGWLNTGDLAKVRDDGMIQICGRQSGLIKIQGYRFHPSEVEQLLSKRFADVQLIATPMNFNGKTRLALFAKPRSEHPITRQDIQSACRQILPRHMIPIRYEIVESWPLNAANKVDRLALRKRIE